MAKSIIQNDKSKCFICERNGYSDRLEEHHIFGGANRKNSETYGLKVYLCGDRCHRNGEHSAHTNPDIAFKLKKIGQQKAMEHYGWSKLKFMQIFGKNYID